MPFLIEQLVGEGVKRKDDKRLATFLRPAPLRPRDLLDLIAAQGRQATFEAVIRGVDLRGAEPRALFFAGLGRWPTAAEVAAFANPYVPQNHLRALLRAPEFRRFFARRALDAFAERRRLFHVRMPRCGTAYIARGADVEHPVLPLDITGLPENSLGKLFEVLGPALYRFTTANTIFMATDRLEPLVYPPVASPDDPDPLAWTFAPPPLRVTDLAFAVIRDPEALLLSQINAVLTALAGDAAQDAPPLARLRRKLGAAAAAPRDAARRILDTVDTRNPICTALGDGTAEGALALCRVSDVALVRLDRLTPWLHTSLGCEPLDPVEVSRPVLRLEDLADADRTALRARIDQDRLFYDRFAAAFAEGGVTFVPGRKM